MLIALEGLDAAGKATQSRKLSERISRRNAKVSLYDFPRHDSPSGQVVNQLLTGKWFPEITPPAAGEDSDADMRLVRAMVVQALMTVNRLEMVQVLEAAAGSARQHMVLDRYFASGLVYGQADGLPLEYLSRIHQTLPSADVWVLVDIPAEESVKRRPKRRDEYERRVGLMEQVRCAYLDLFERPVFPGHWVIVDGMGTEDEVHERIFSAVEPAL